jgi:uncharacterized repeat protein (TIGR01451 family)
MPTQNNDSSAIAVSPAVEATQARSRRIVGISLGATLVTIVALFGAIALAPTDASAANTCTLTSTQPTTTWGDTTKWSCSPTAGTYPGQGAGDTAIVTLGGYTLKVDAFNNPVTLQVSGSAGSIPIQVASGGTLTLETSSTATSSNTFTVDSGGTMGTNTGANIAGFQANVHVNGGTFNSAGTIALTSGTFTYSGGSLTGGGTINITNSGIFDGAVGAMPISATTINDSGFLSYTSAANAITLSSGASINVTGAGQFSIASDAAINGTATETISIANGSSMQKTSGTGFNVISCFVKNDGTMTVAGAGSGGGFGLSGNGAHTGSFVTGSSSQTIAFGGNNAFNSGTSFSGATPIKFAAGTQTFNAAVTASGGLKWAGGGIAGTGPFNISGTSTLDGSNSGMILTGVINNSGAMTYAPTVITNLLTINGATAKLDTTGGTFTIAGDYDIQAVPSGAGMLRVSGGTGQITKSAGASGSSILANVDNSSSTVTNNATGALNFAGGGKSTGNISVPASSNIMNFTNGTFDDNGVFSGLGTINTAGGTLNINAATSFGSGSPSLNLNGGTLGGTGTVTILGASNWSSGTITGSSPFNVSSTGVVAITGALGPMTLDGRTFNDNSSVVYNSPTNNLTLKNSASILNSGTFTAIGTGTIDTDGSAVSITNNGQFSKTNSSLFIVKPTFNNNGTGVSITGGVLDIDADGTSSAPWNMSAGTEVWFPMPFGTTYTWASGTSFSGGKVTIDGSGTVATSFPMTLNNTNLEVKGGIFSTPSLFTVTTPGTLKWKGGTLSGAGHTVISAGTTFDMTTENSSRSVSTHTIDNAGNATLSATSQPPSLDNGSTFNNTGNLDIQSDGSMFTNGSGSNSFNNSGSVKKSGGVAAFVFQVPYNQTAGTTDANSGTGTSNILFNAGGSMSGGVLKATTNGDSVGFQAGTFNVSGGSFNGGAPGKIALAGSATLNINAPVSTTSFIQGGGMLQGSSTLTVSSGGAYDWSGGTMTGAGQFAVASGGTLSITGTSSTPLQLTSHTISNSGTINYGPLSGGQNNQLILIGSASIANQSGGILDLTDASSIFESGGATTIVNSGTIRKLTATGSTIQPAITNTGTIKPTLGVISPISGTSTGTLDAGVGGTLNFGGGSTFTINGGTWGASGGGFQVSGGDVTFSAPFSLSGLTLSSGQIDGSSTLTLTGVNAWNGGTMAGSGTTTNSGGATLAMVNTNTSTLDTRTFNNNGTVNYQNGGSVLHLQNGALFTNTGTFDVQGDAGMACNCAVSPTFHNIGSFNKTAGTGVAAIGVPFNNDGTVAANLGAIQFTQNGTHNGVFSMLAAGTIEFTANNTFSNTSTISGAGKVIFDNGTSTIASSLVTPGTLTLNSGSVTLNSAATVGTLTINNTAVLSGTGALNINAASPLSEWTGGTISGSGTLTVGASSNFIIDGITGAMTLNTRPIVNNGSTNYSAGTNGLTMMNGAVITNASGATLTLDATPAIAASGGGNAISNAGILQRTQVGSLGIGPSVTNTGTINANAGQLAFNGGLTQSSGSMNLLGGSIYSPITISLAGGSLTGSGTVFAPLNNSGGIVAPGAPGAAGTITLNGPYSQGSGGSMNLKIGGIGPGGTYDVVDTSTSSVNLAGTLNVTLFNSFTPSSGNTFDVLKFASRSGDFATYNLPTFAGGGSFQNAYVAGSPNFLRLTAIVTASDLQITQSAPPTVVHNQNQTWTVTVTNGPTPVTNVVVTDTFSNATLVSATSIGPCTGTGPVTCTLGSLGANQSVNVALVMNANTLATISNSASVTATEFDPNTANNNAGPAFTTVVASADLSITNTASANPVNAGAPLSFVLNVANAGPDATSGTITVSNTVPSGVTAAIGSGTGWSCGALSGSVITCTSTTSIPASGNAPSLTIAMNAPASGTAVDSASVSAVTADPNAGNNTASQSVTVTPRADVSITKNTSSAGIAGQSMVYTIVVTNSGPSTASAVSVADPTPTGLTFVSNSGACTSAFPCALGNLTNGQSATITSTYTIAPGAAGSVVTNTATVSSTTSDPTPTNNTAVKTTSITGSADLTITKSGPPSSIPGSTIAYTITVTNNGPSDATAVSVTDATPANTTFVSNSGACASAFPCSLGTITAGQSKTMISTFTVDPSFTGSSIANSATVSSATSDPNAGNNTATAITSFGSSADLAITKSGPTAATTGSTVTYTLTITNTGPGAAANVSVSDATPAGLSFVATGGACFGAFPCALGNLESGQSITATASYTVTATSGSMTNTAQVSGTTVDPNAANDSSSVTTAIGTNTCGQQPPSLVAPANGAMITSPVTFSWTAVQGATGYKLFASIDGASTQEIGSTSATSLTLSVASGNVTWSVQALGVPNCTQLNSTTRTFSVCSLDAPVIAVVGTNTSGQTYTVSWTALPGITSYELQEAATAAFDNATSLTVTGTSRTFTKNATTPTAFFYRVRALGGCSQSGGPFSASERVVIVPIPPINTQDNSAVVDINNKKVVVQSVFIPGQGAATPYSATTDEPWLTVSPATGTLLPQGITLQVSADPADLPNGTFTATIILTLGSSAKVGTLDTKPTVSVPVSISVVTPVSPATLSTPPANSLIIPSVGHLDGINSQWRSDVRITNTAQQKINYLLRFTPAGGDPSAIKQTQISIAANDTMALDDIVKNWYGVGALGDAANGVLEVRPLNTSGKGAPNAEDVNVSLVTVASSRTFNQSAGGTLGQYIPAIPFANFIGKFISGDARAGILSMQQIAQSNAYRTNLGIVEAAGKPASVLVSVFDAAGKNLLDLPIDLKAGEQQQLNSFLGAKGITLTDGRIEVKVTGGDGKVIAYASVVDNKTTDPLLVTGTPLAQTPARSYVLPGVADLSNGGANWRSDLRVFNAGTDPQYVTMTLYPQTGSASSDPISRSVAINPGEVSILDNILSSRFGVTNIGGALHVDTLSDANLVVTGRTYNQVDGGGTYGQFIAAVTPADAVGKGGRTLNVLQVEDSTRYRTNLGIAEVSGKPVTVEVSVLLPDAKVAPKLQIPLAANEYRQFRVLQQLGVGTAYNARITIRVIDGDGRIAAYGSVVDMQTQDPTYVPAQ